MQFDNRQDCDSCINRCCATFGADGLAKDIDEFVRECKEKDVVSRRAVLRFEASLETARELVECTETLDKSWQGLLAAWDAQRYTRMAEQFTNLTRETGRLFEDSRTLVVQLERAVEELTSEEREAHGERFQSYLENAREGAEHAAEVSRLLAAAVAPTLQDLSESIEETRGGRVTEAILSRPAHVSPGATAFTPGSSLISPGRASLTAASTYGNLLGLNKTVLVRSTGLVSAAIAKKVVTALDARTIREETNGRTIYRIDPTARTIVPTDKLHATGGQLSWYKEIRGRTDILRRYLEQLICRRCCCDKDNLITIKDGMGEIFDDIVREVGQPERPSRARLCSSLASLSDLGCQLENELAGHSGGLRQDELEVGEAEKERRHITRLREGLDELDDVIRAMLDDLESAKGPMIVQLLRVNEAIPDKVDNLLAQMDAAGLVEGQRRAFRVPIHGDPDTAVLSRNDQDTTVEEGLQWVRTAAEDHASKLGRGDIFRFEARTMENIANAQSMFVDRLLQCLPRFIPSGSSYVDIALKDLKLAVDEKLELAREIAGDFDPCEEGSIVWGDEDDGAGACDDDPGVGGSGGGGAKGWPRPRRGPPNRRRSRRQRQRKRSPAGSQATYMRGVILSIDRPGQSFIIKPTSIGLPNRCEWKLTDSTEILGCQDLAQLENLAQTRGVEVEIEGDLDRGTVSRVRIAGRR